MKTVDMNNSVYSGVARLDQIYSYGHLDKTMMSNKILLEFDLKCLTNYIIGPSGVCALPLAAGMHKGGHYVM